MYANHVSGGTPPAGHKADGGMPHYASVHGPTPHPSVFSHAKRPRKANLAGILFNILAPWSLFSVLSAVVSFSFHYKYPEMTRLIQVIGCVPALLAALLGFSAWRQGRDPAWYAFSTLAFTLAAFLSAAAGGRIFEQYMKPSYQIESLNTYASVNPAAVKGAQMMDAGRVNFAAGTSLDVRMAMGFKSGDEDTYCVAPIVHGEGRMNGAYDFWAVGVNCCSGVSADFRCGEWDNPNANSGLRLLREDERPFFRLAVQQAEAAYEVKATHPVFFHWMQDPMQETIGYRANGAHEYMAGVLLHFGFSCFAVFGALMMILLGKLQRPG